MDNDKIIEGLVGNYLDIEREISTQKADQRALRSAIRALKGLDALKTGVAAYKADMKAQTTITPAKGSK